MTRRRLRAPQTVIYNDPTTLKTFPPVATFWGGQLPTMNIRKLLLQSALVIGHDLADTSSRTFCEGNPTFHPSIRKSPSVSTSSSDPDSRSHRPFSRSGWRCYPPSLANANSLAAFFRPLWSIHTKLGPPFAFSPAICAIHALFPPSLSPDAYLSPCELCVKAAIWHLCRLPDPS